MDLSSRSQSNGCFLEDQLERGSQEASWSIKAANASFPPQAVPSRLCMSPSPPIEKEPAEGLRTWLLTAFRPQLHRLPVCNLPLNL